MNELPTRGFRIPTETCGLTTPPCMPIRSAKRGYQEGTGHGLRQLGGARASSGVPSVKDRPSGRLIRLILADDQPIALAGLDALFRHDSGFLVLQRCANGAQVIRAVIAHRPDILLLAWNLPPTDAIGVVRALRAKQIVVRTILLADSPSAGHFEMAVRLGVQGVVFMTMEPQLVLECVRDVFAGKCRLGGQDVAGEDSEVGASPLEPGALTRRQIEVARAVATGLSNKEVATQLSLSEGTIKNHLHAVYERLNLDNRLELLLYFRQKATTLAR
jgi:DNA-binding NarL/FixJ family response regulator